MKAADRHRVPRSWPQVIPLPHLIRENPGIKESNVCQVDIMLLRITRTWVETSGVSQGKKAPRQ